MLWIICPVLSITESLDTQSDRHTSRHRDGLMSGADNKAVYGSASHMASRSSGTYSMDKPSKVSEVLTLPVSYVKWLVAAS